MILLKSARLKENKFNLDSICDIAGYAACASELCPASKEPPTSVPTPSEGSDVPIPFTPVKSPENEFEYFTGQEAMDRGLSKLIGDEWRLQSKDLWEGVLAGPWNPILDYRRPIKPKPAEEWMEFDAEYARNHGLVRMETDQYGDADRKWRNITAGLGECDWSFGCKYRRLISKP